MNKVYKIVLSKIIEKLEQGVVPWHCPWSGGMPMNYVTRRPYSGINILLLGMLEYPYPYFVTRKQVYEQGGSLRPGSRSHLVVYYKPYRKDTEHYDEDKQEWVIDGETRYVLRYYSVYNISQTTLKLPEVKPINRIQRCEHIVNDMPECPLIIHKYQKAYYSPGKDLVNIPLINTFENAELYYGTLFHELIHATGHEKRLNRKTITEAHAFGSGKYSQEELIAEIGAAFLSAHAGITRRTIDDSASYIQGWLEKLRESPLFLFHCSSQAKQAVSFILGNSDASPGCFFLYLTSVICK